MGLRERSEPLIGPVFEIWRPGNATDLVLVPETPALEPKNAYVSVVRLKDLVEVNVLCVSESRPSNVDSLLESRAGLNF